MTTTTATISSPASPARPAPRSPMMQRIRLFGGKLLAIIAAADQRRNELQARESDQPIPDCCLGCGAGCNAVEMDQCAIVKVSLAQDLSRDRRSPDRPFQDAQQHKDVPSPATREGGKESPRTNFSAARDGASTGSVSMTEAVALVGEAADPPVADPPPAVPVACHRCGRTPTIMPSSLDPFSGNVAPPIVCCNTPACVDHAESFHSGATIATAVAKWNLAQGTARSASQDPERWDFMS